MPTQSKPRNTSDQFHIVISTKELQNIDELEAYYVGLKHISSYIITQEHGTNGHAHLDSFIILTQNKRQDKVREHLIKSLYKHVDPKEHINIRVVVNHIDPDPRYGIGYALKEDPVVVRTNIDKEYRNASIDYYFFNKDKVEKVKASMSFDRKKYITVDEVMNSYLEYCEKINEPFFIYRSVRDANLMNCSVHPLMQFRTFHIQFSEFIPYSVYARLNETTMQNWVESCLQQRAHSLDCAPATLPP